MHILSEKLVNINQAKLCKKTKTIKALYFERTKAII